MAFEPNSRVPASPEQAAAAPDDVLRALVTTLVQETIQAEFARFLGAAPYERTARRRGAYPKVCV